ncbi:LOW QUALITY PROTEIN: cysteine protease ATG4-like [Primulina tabacum]|uniref:LOW QUALITY PROTEIN: cysteine protease ATG4-like n=1 Tax=Primulina tabacum TaxID=48773 RepID=UPI003F59934C
MKGSLEKDNDRVDNHNKKNCSFDCRPEEILGSVLSEAESSIGSSTNQKPGVLWSGVWAPALSILGNLSSDHGRSDSKSCCVRKKSGSGNNYYEGCKAAVRRVMINAISMRRILGFGKTGSSASKSDIWLLGMCYQVAQEGDNANSSDPAESEGFASFVEDFSSRILITYRKGFVSIGETKYAGDVNWGCMLRSSQMLVAQAFLFHKLGRSWRKSPHKPIDQSYMEILHLFGDAEDSPFSIHNLLQAGKDYGLAPGSWVGPYAMCRTWESMVHNKIKDTGNGVLSSMMTIYVVSGSDGERGGAPVLCIEDIFIHLSEFSGGELVWGPILLMVPLVLGVEKVNPRYLPLLSATLMFPQSLGILGGRPGASTYIVGVQDEKAFYLDPHEVQQVVDIKRDNLDVDTSSYHCNIVRHMPLDSIDSSLAIGFYCKDKRDFDDFCSRASELIDQSNGAPLFTISETRLSPKPTGYQIWNTSTDHTCEARELDLVNDLSSDMPENICTQEDDWQLL